MHHDMICDLLKQQRDAYYASTHVHPRLCIEEVFRSCVNTPDGETFLPEDDQQGTKWARFVATCLVLMRVHETEPFVFQWAGNPVLLTLFVVQDGIARFQVVTTKGFTWEVQSNCNGVVSATCTQYIADPLKALLFLHEQADQCMEAMNPWLTLWPSRDCIKAVHTRYLSFFSLVEELTRALYRFVVEKIKPNIRCNSDNEKDASIPSSCERTGTSTNSEVIQT